MQDFFQDIKNSFYGPKYYQGLLKKPFFYSLRLFVMFGLLVALLSALVFSFAFLPRVKSVLSQAGTQLIEHFPSELQLTVKDNKVSTNVPEPYFIKVPVGFSAGPQVVENLAVIDTQTAFSFEKFKEYKSVI